MELDNSLEKEKRPVFLTVLCILTFVSTGFGALSGISGLFGGAPSEEEVVNSNIQVNQSIEQFQKLKWDGMVHILKQLQAMTEEVYANFYVYNLLSFLIVALGLAGAIFMFQGKKIGFYMYIAYSLAGTILTYIMISTANIPTILTVFQLLISGIFVLMYSRNLWWMK